VRNNYAKAIFYPYEETLALVWNNFQALSHSLF
jgi:hypothetical protein